jgi:hypothetical protein
MGGITYPFLRQEGTLELNHLSSPAAAGAKENELNKDDRLCPSSLNCNTLTARCQAQIKLT